MLHLKDHNAYFVHVPKTGGTWVRKVLQELGLRLEEVGMKHTYEQDRLLKAESVFSVYRGFRTWSESFWLMKQRGGRQMGTAPTYVHKHRRHGVPKMWPERLDTLAYLPLPDYRKAIIKDYNDLMVYYRDAGTVANHRRGSFELLPGNLAEWLNSLGIEATEEGLKADIPPVNTRYGI